jgi:hypothetical protein
VRRSIIEFKLHVNPSAKPRMQKFHKMSNEKIVVAKAEVQRLLDVGFIREVQFPTWLANVVMVKKEERKMTHVHRFYRSKHVPPEG